MDGLARRFPKPDLVLIHGGDRSLLAVCLGWARIHRESAVNPAALPSELSKVTKTDRSAKAGSQSTIAET